APWKGGCRGRPAMGRLDARASFVAELGPSSKARLARLLGPAKSVANGRSGDSARLFRLSDAYRLDDQGERVLGGRPRGVIGCRRLASSEYPFASAKEDFRPLFFRHWTSPPDPGGEAWRRPPIL